MIFLEMAAGIDDRTWVHHRQAGDYSRWFREAIKNEQLAREPAEIERDTRLDPKESRDRIAQAVSRRYTAPAHEVDYQLLSLGRKARLSRRVLQPSS